MYLIYNKPLFHTHIYYTKRDFLTCVRPLFIAFMTLDKIEKNGERIRKDQRENIWRYGFLWEDMALCVSFDLLPVRFKKRDL